MSVDQAATTPIQSSAQVTVTAHAPIKAFSDGDEGPSFKDVLDIINPLQHIPIINTIYRHLTGDEEGAVADVAGGALYAGPVGLVGSMIDLAVKGESGRSIGDNILHWLGFDDDEDEAKTQTAQTQQAQQAQQTAAAVAPPPAVTVTALAALPARQRGDDKADRKDSAKKDEADAPAKIGDFMVFGGAGGNQPVSLTPNQPAAPVMAAASVDQDAAGPRRQGQFMVFGDAAQPAQAALQTAAAKSDDIAHQGDYWVFGATAAPAAPARPVQLAQATAAFGPQAMPAALPMAPATASVTANSPLPAASAPAPAAAPATPAGLSPMPSRTFATPARRTQVTPNSLGMPTTGPAAVPGHSPSQATQTQTTADNANWFSQALNAGLDKYAAAQRLGGQDNAAASAAAGAQATTLH